MREQHDSGQMMAALMVALMLLLLAVAVVVILPLGAVTEMRTRSQTAADAAALAAADALRSQWVAGLTDPAGPPGPRSATGSTPLGDGEVRQEADVLVASVAADAYARENGSRLVDLQIVGGSVSVEVEALRTAYPELGLPRSTARAALGASCDWSPRPLVPTLEQDPDAAPPTFTSRLTCGDLQADFTFDNSSSRGFPMVGPAPALDPVALSEALEPRLVG